ncbi:phosphate ABC transporter permease PstA [Thermosulfurimonas dismutans]|uniref:Phosphate transport system permease protein PstA n=1 Tax=Thermosulfurimonas dismutans TaxID=999894 RepID=A0A179D6G0_9BACT|nr:phosphate ABC transporter permease PstA [Thermosulfurimonas dismutans]OAQ21695.1 Phosphate transport system permease protein PstA [Thermosulfurimonas dismutans]
MNRLLYRKLKDRLAFFLILVLALCPTLPLFHILLGVVKQGISSISLEFFIHLPKPPGEEGGGVGNAIVGTLMLALSASLLAVPIGILCGVYLSEYAKGRFGEAVRIAADVLQGTPSIVFGIIAYLWVVKPMGHFSAFSGSVALAIMMLPVIVRSTEEILRMIPETLREASLALGVNYWRTVLKVIIPTGLVGITTGILLSLARIMGETAPLLFTAFGNPFWNFNPMQPVEALPLVVFKYAISPYEEWIRQAWGASLVLTGLVLVLNLSARLLARRMGGHGR